MKLKIIEDKDLLNHLDKLPSDSLVPFLLEGGALRGGFISATRMVNQMRVNHGLGILESLVLGHAAMGAGLLSSNLKGGDKYGLKIECGGPIRGLTAEADYEGNVRGSLFENPIPVTEPLKDFNLSPFFGPGFLTVSKYHGTSAEPFSGQVMIEHGNIAQDLALYFKQSEQTPTAFSLSVDFDSTGRVVGAGGLFLQVMPGASEETAGAVQDTVLGLPSIGKALAGGLKPEEFLASHFSGFGLNILDGRDVRFFCGCTRERFSSFLASMSEKEKSSILNEGPFPMQAVCHNCGTTYTYEKGELETLLR
ncbi:MAG: Hsp33 family molecular chaperone HslO [Spirochaetales bacterium]|nr:Hsp33 family molecular chaperone HslO [Spirochaetales bacterium]